MIQAIIEKTEDENNPKANLIQTEDKFFSACPFDKDYYLPTAEAAGEEKYQTKALIVPHHLLAKDLIYQAFKSIEGKYKTVIVVGPNHFNAGNSKVQTSERYFKTAFGNLVINKELVDRLNKENLAKTEEDNFYHEHSVCALVSFVKYFFPESRIVPLILKGNLKLEEAKALGEFLARNCDKCLLVISSDFSHEVSAGKAENNDRQSIKILQQFIKEKIGNITCDSRPSMEVLFAFLTEFKAEKMHLIGNTNSEAISGVESDTVTSYVAAGFD